MPIDDVKILRQSEGTQFLQGGGSQKVIVTTFNVGSDGPFTVTVPEDGFQAASTVKLIETKADQVRALRAALPK
jgi:hypothetical protein